MTDPAWPTPEEVLAALDQAGHLLEQQVATELAGLGYFVETNRAFTDIDEGKSREGPFKVPEIELAETQGAANSTALCEHPFGYTDGRKRGPSSHPGTVAGTQQSEGPTHDHQ